MAYEFEKTIVTILALIKTFTTSAVNTIVRIATFDRDIKQLLLIFS